MNITLNKNDEVVMRLVHYFITKKGYNPIILHGAKDEIWLENSENDYEIVRIVTNYIHNDEQLNIDLFRTKQIVKKIKNKTFSFRINTLSIFLNLGNNVHLKDTRVKNIDLVKLNSWGDLGHYNFIIDTFPDILEVEHPEEEGLALFMKLTDDINDRNKEEAIKAEDIFSRKRPIVTYALLISNLILFIAMALSSKNMANLDAITLYHFGGLTNYHTMGSITEMYRLVTSIFLHAGLIHLLCNMYSLYVLGPQVENFFGKKKFLLIYLGSGIIGNLFSMLYQADNIISVGASGAIFGLLGALVYFGYHYRVYLGQVLKAQIIPLIILNLFIGFAVSGINNIAHVGGLIGGYMVTKAVGIKYKTSIFDNINGIIVLVILVSFLSFMILHN